MARSSRAPAEVIHLPMRTPHRRRPRTFEIAGGNAGIEEAVVCHFLGESAHGR